MPSHLFSLCYEVLSGYLRGFEISLPPAVLTMLGVCGVRLSWLRWVFPQYKTFMNIMLVSVTERTREIGTRKALGAPASAIRMQFITESVILCLIGGVIGVVLGIAAGVGLSTLMEVPGKPSISSIVVAVGFSMAIGVFFGYYPANKAAKLDPIEALRYE